MNKFKNEILPKFNEVWMKGRDWFVQFLFVADNSPTKMMFLLKENKKQWRNIAEIAEKEDRYIHMYVLLPDGGVYAYR